MPGGGRRLPRFGAGRVAVAALRVSARPDVADRLVDHRGRHGDLGVVRRAERHDLHHGHTQVLVAGLGLIPPAARGRLRLDDQVDRLAQRLLELGIGVHPVHLGQSQGGQAVLVHRAERDVAVFLVSAREQELLPAFQDVAVRPAAGSVAAAHEGQKRKRVDGVVVVPASVGLLLRGEIAEAAVDRRRHPLDDLDLRERIGRGRLGRGCVS